MKGRHIMFGAVGGFVLILIAVACPETQDQKPRRQQLSLAEAILDLSSSDPRQWEATEDALLALGPDALPGLKRISELAAHIAAMHDKLLASADETKNWGAVNREATEAINYFAANGAVPYLLVGLDSPNIGLHIRIGRALAQLDAGTKEEYAPLLVATLAQRLASWPEVLLGSENVTLNGLATGILRDLLGELIGVETNDMSTDELLARAKEWLTAHAVEQDAPAGQDLPSDEGTPKEK